jgi:hemerythrin-like domain-containing protein
MILLINSTSAPSFDHPLEMLRACHGKILHQCDTLIKIPVHLFTHGCDLQVQQAAQAILNYFDTAGQFHHMDEEQNLFPMLRTTTGMNVALLDRLLSEHEVMITSWEALRPALAKLAQGVEVALENGVMNKFIDRYSAHITLENSELLPLAQTLLSDTQLKMIGRKMAERRGVKF